LTQGGSSNRIRQLIIDYCSAQRPALLLMAALRLIQYKQLCSSLSSYLFDAILSGELRSGERIVEGKLARQLGIAQGPYGKLRTNWNTKGSSPSKETAVLLAAVSRDDERLWESGSAELEVRRYQTGRQFAAAKVLPMAK
jgi:hypothetical protein